MCVEDDGPTLDPGVADHEAVARHGAAFGAEMAAVVFDKGVDLYEGPGVDKRLHEMPDADRGCGSVHAQTSASTSFGASVSCRPSGSRAPVPAASIASSLAIRAERCSIARTIDRALT